jgi:hypothetical protein
MANPKLAAMDHCQQAEEDEQSSQAAQDRAQQGGAEAVRAWIATHAGKDECEPCEPETHNQRQEQEGIEGESIAVESTEGQRDNVA